MAVNVMRGLGRVLMVLAGVYWLAAVTFAATAYLGANRTYKAERPYAACKASEAAWTKCKQAGGGARCTPPSDPYGGAFVSFECDAVAPPWLNYGGKLSPTPLKVAGDVLIPWAVGFAIICAVGLALRWIVQGFVPKETT